MNFQFRFKIENIKYSLYLIFIAIVFSSCSIQNHNIGLVNGKTTQKRLTKVATKLQISTEIKNTVANQSSISENSKNTLSLKNNERKENLNKPEKLIRDKKIVISKSEISHYNPTIIEQQSDKKNTDKIKKTDKEPQDKNSKKKEPFGIVSLVLLGLGILIFPPLILLSLIAAIISLARILTNPEKFSGKNLAIFLIGLSSLLILIMVGFIFVLLLLFTGGI